WNRNGSVARLSPEARVLVEEGQRLERRHSIEEEHAVQVIGFVLDHARRKIVRVQLEALGVAVQCSNLDLPGAGDAPADIGDAEAALPILHDVVANSRD